MSCFGAVVPGTYDYYASSGRPAGAGSRRPWRWWRAKCAGIAAAVGSRLRRSIKGIGGRRRRRQSSVHGQSGRLCHHHQRRSFAPVYIDELYSHNQPAAKALLRVVQAEEQPSAKLAAAAAPPPCPPVSHAAAAARDTTGRKATADPGRVPARVGAAATTAGGADGARAGSGKQKQPPGVGGAMRNVLLRSPGRGGGVVLGVAKGMGEVDLRAELFIRRFKEDMRLQSQRSAEELQAMLARGL